MATLVRPAPPVAPPAAAPPPPAPAPPDPGHRATQVLAILQRDGRLIDFLMEDLTAYDDAQIGAAVRDVHAGSRQATAALFHARTCPGRRGRATGHARTKRRRGARQDRRQRDGICGDSGRPPSPRMGSDACGLAASAIHGPQRRGARGSRSPIEPPVTSRFVVGIDLGTTNCALAWADTSADPGTPDPHAGNPAAPQPGRAAGIVDCCHRFSTSPATSTFRQAALLCPGIHRPRRSSGMSRAGAGQRTRLGSSQARNPGSRTEARAGRHRSCRGVLQVKSLTSHPSRHLLRTCVISLPRSIRTLPVASARSPSHARTCC